MIFLIDLINILFNLKVKYLWLPLAQLSRDLDAALPLRLPVVLELEEDARIGRQLGDQHCRDQVLAIDLVGRTHDHWLGGGGV